MRKRRRRHRLRPLRLVVVAAVVAGAVGAVWWATGGRGQGTNERAGAQAQATATGRKARLRHVLQTPPPLALPRSLPARTVRLPILMYHRIDLLRPSLRGISRRLTVDPADFAAQMEWLVRHGYHAVSQLQAFAALEHGVALPRKPVMITFDDGYRDVLVNAAPVLRRLRMPATAYIITDRVFWPPALNPSFLTWGELQALERAGVTIGSHTVSHAELTMRSDAQALRELHQSRATLERHLGHPVQWFAYPAGAEDARVVALVREAGYALAVTTKPGSVQDAAHPLELHRYEVLDSTGVPGLAAILGQ